MSHRQINACSLEDGLIVQHASSILIANDALLLKECNADICLKKRTFEKKDNTNFDITTLFETCIDDTFFGGGGGGGIVAQIHNYVYMIMNILKHCAQYTLSHYDDVIMGAMASQITSLTIFYSTAYSDADQRKHRSSASLAFVRGIHRGPMNSPHKWPVTRKIFPFHDVIMFWARSRGALIPWFLLIRAPQYSWQ